MFKNEQEFRNCFLDKLNNVCGKTLLDATENDKYRALSYLVRDLITKQWLETKRITREQKAKEVYYFSIEFLLGRLLQTNLLNLGQEKEWGNFLGAMDIDLENIASEEKDAGLGNGGLGRLAACFLDSMATLKIAGHGCGIRYKHGLFEQKIIDGYQVEHADQWLLNGNTWEFRKSEKAVTVKFGGTVQSTEVAGKLQFTINNAQIVKAIPYDIPIVGYHTGTANTLRLWSAEAIDSQFDLISFNQGNHLKAIEYKYSIEAISEILYPDDSHYEGKVLRLKQQYFFVSAGLQSILRHHKKLYTTCTNLNEKITIHINDTHPALVIPELMRLLMDEEGLDWEEAFAITKNTVAYTNHTILPEALEKWPIDIVKSQLPRIFIIINEINEHFCHKLWLAYPGDWQKISAMAIIADGYVHMANLAVVGSYSINGVAKIHTKILTDNVLNKFFEYEPSKFNNKTNGITHRRWLLTANPILTRHIQEAIGDEFIYNPTKLEGLLKYRNDRVFLEKLYVTKQYNKDRLAKYINEKYGTGVDSMSIFDVHIKRIHAYKRQLLNALRIIYLYQKIKDNPQQEIVPRTFIFAGKAAPGYYMAKKIIKLINTLADMINRDIQINDKMKIVFLENYNVSLGEIIFPAADISEQISTASKEASGTGNMKFMLNGAVTVGTMDGANVEMFEKVGAENIFIFGLTAEEVLTYYQQGTYRPQELYAQDIIIQRVLDALINGTLGGAKDEFKVIYESLVNSDEYFVLKDFHAYVNIQEQIANAYTDNVGWNKMCLHNIAQAGYFSSDRTIAEYAKDIWRV